MLRRLDDVFAFPASHCNSPTITACTYPKIVAIWKFEGFRFLELKMTKLQNNSFEVEAFKVFE